MYPLVKGIQDIKGPAFFQGEIIMKYEKNALRNFMNLLLQNHFANFKQTWQKSSLSKGESSLFNWRAPPFSKKDKNEIVKIHWQILKSSSSGTLGQFHTNLSQIILWRWFKFVKMKDPAFFQGEIISELRKYIFYEFKKSSSPEPLGQLQPKLA